MGLTERDLRYSAKVDERAADECWPWLAGHNRHGYGTFRGEGNDQLAHRYGYKMRVGPIAPGQVVCHSCDNPECQNPLHWFLGTPSDNTSDMMLKGRHHPVYLQGVRNGQSVLSDRDVSGIVRLHDGGLTQVAIAEQYGITQSAVGKILRGERWQHLTGGLARSRPTRRASGDTHHNAKITRADAETIRHRYAADGCSQQSLADEYGISQHGVSQIVRGLRWVK